MKINARKRGFARLLTPFNADVIRTLRLGPRAKTRIGRRNWNNS